MQLNKKTQLVPVTRLRDTNIQPEAESTADKIESTSNNS